MEKDRTFYIPILCLIFLIGLISFHYLPPITLFGYEVKTLNMFSDIEKENKVEVPVTISTVKPELKAQCPEGQVCFEDYSPNQSTFKNLIVSLNNINKGEKVRIAFFGDSFIEGDVLCGDFRDMLQEKFGGEGVGLVPVTSEVSQFRQTIKEDFKGFESFDAVHQPKEKVPYPPFGLCAIPQEGNQAVYYSVHFSPRTQQLPPLRIFYQSKRNIEAKITSGSGTQNVKLLQGRNIQMKEVEYIPSQKISLSFTPASDAYLYGVSFEGEKGVYVDNFALRGNAGFSLLSSKPEMHEALNKIQDYKLIILQYGVNAIDDKTTNFDWYIRMMKKVISEIKEKYPQAGILLIGVGDRSHKENGEYKTMPSIKAMVEVQRAIASGNKIAFWNMYGAMGGENSMVGYVKASPPKANLDYIHLNFLGGKDIAGLLFKSLIFEYEKDKTK